jgi:hypothetical protein
MSDKQAADKDDRGDSRWDEGIRALINGNVHHEADGTRLHESESEQAESKAEAKPGSAKRPSGKKRAKQSRHPSVGGAQQKKRRRAS